MSSNKYAQDKTDVFNRTAEDNTAAAHADELFGEVDIPNRKTIKPKYIPLDKIHADPRQPRRAVPPALRGAWDGNPANVPAMLENWRREASQRIQRPIDVARLIIQKDNRVLADVETEDPIATGYIKLVQLAASIRSSGLLKPPTVRPEGGAYRLNSGERRTLAYHLVYLTTGDNDFSEMPVFINNKANVWSQAEENNTNDDLNAIQDARTLALLLIDLYENVDGVDFNTWDELVIPGGSDRAYYAQVSNGYIFKAQPLQPILTAMGLTSARMLSAYRSLLTIPDRLWLLADNYNFTENKIRDVMRFVDEGAWESHLNTMEDAPLIDYIDNAIEQGKAEKQNSSSLPTGKLPPPTNSGELLPTGNNVTPTRPSTEEMDNAVFSASPSATRPPLPPSTTTWKDTSPRPTEAEDTQPEPDNTPPTKTAPPPNRRAVLRNGELIHIPVSQLQPGDQLIDDPDDLPLQPGDRVQIDNRAGTITQVSPEAARVEFDDLTVLNLPAHQWHIIDILPTHNTPSPDEEEPQTSAELDRSHLIIKDDAVLMLWASEAILRGLPEHERLSFDQLRQWILDVSPEEIRRSITEEGITAAQFTEHVATWLDQLHTVLDRWTDTLADETDNVIRTYAEIEKTLNK